MKALFIVAVSSRQPPWARAAEEFYSRRIRSFELRVTTVKPGTTAAREDAALLAKAPAAARLILLDRGGARLDGDGFAAAVGGWLEAARPTAFVIGGADGAGDGTRRAAHETLSLSPMTFPHALARLILIEQLFRADCVMRHHPYPR